jgi:DNA-binding CsgD family transcriptional regulator
MTLTPGVGAGELYSTRHRSESHRECLPIFGSRPIDTIERVTLVERDGELAALRGHWERASAGEGGMVVVAGEPGGGKSVLVETFVDQLDGDTTVLWGACDPLSTPRPLGPVHDVAAKLGAPVETLLRDADQPHEIFAAVFERLRAEPTILVVDDLHWADQGTIDLLRFLLRRLRSCRSLLIGTVRDAEIGPSPELRSLLGDVARSPDAISVTLRPLSVDGVAELVAGRALDPARMHQLTGGNPFFVGEMLGHVGESLPITVRDAILARTAELDSGAWDVLHLLACAPEAIPDQLLSVLGVTLPPLRALDEAGLIKRGPRGVTFRHDLCRLAAVGTIPPGGEVSLHRRMLDALETWPRADPAVLVHHALGAGDDQRLCDHAAAAGRAAVRAGAHTQAAAFFHIALDHIGVARPESEAELLELLAHESYLIDRLDDAIAASERAMVMRARAGDVAGVSRNHHELSVYEWYNANRPAAEGHASKAIALLQEPGAQHGNTDRSQLGHTLATQAYLALQLNDLERARAIAAQADEVAATANDDTLRLRLALIDGISILLADEQIGRDRVLSVLQPGVDHFDEIYSTGFSNLSYLDIEQRRLRDAAGVLEVSIPLTIDHDVAICHAWQLGSRGRLQLLQGEWADALADAEAVLATPSAPLARTWPLLVRGLVALRRSGTPSPDLDRAWELANRFGEPMRQLPAAAALVEQAWLTGLADDRIPACRALLNGTDRPGLQWGRGELTAWLQRFDRDQPAPAVTDGDSANVAEPFQLQLAGAFEAAAARWDLLESPYEKALASIESGDPQLCRAGLDILDRLGADAVAAKLRRDLRVAGMTAVPAPRRATTRTNPAGLTTRELDVVRLLEEGLTNGELADRLFLSRKTVDHHVSAILTKLGVTNRRDAVRAARRLGVVD